MTSASISSGQYLSMSLSALKFIACKPGGVFHQNRTWMCLPDLRNLTISIPIFFAKFPTHQYTIFERKAPNLIKLGAFYNNLPKIHPIYVIWVPLSLMKTPRSLYQISRKKCPKRQAHVRIPCQCENPPPRACKSSISTVISKQQCYKSSMPLSVDSIFLLECHQCHSQQ